MRYYLNRIRNTQTTWAQSQSTKSSERYLSKSVLEDLKLWKNYFLPKVSDGMSLNLISYRCPSYICWSDACPQGLGGYDYMGNAWRFHIPEVTRQKVLYQNNSLEFIASVIAVWIAITNKYIQKEMCILAQGDNAPAIGWLHKANVDENKNLPMHIAARKYAEILLVADCCLYSQHISGIKNNVADTLSRRHDLSDADLTKFICTTYPSQVPGCLTIYQLLLEISSWVTYWLQKCSERTESQKTQKTKNLESGEDGWNMRDSLSSNRTYGLKTSHLKVKQGSLGPSQQLCKDDSFQDQIKMIWQQEQSKRPWQNWVRSLGQTWGTTPHMAWDPMDSTQA